MVEFSISESFIVSLFVQSVVHGIHIMAFAFNAWTLLDRPLARYRQHTDWLMVVTAAFLFANDLYMNIHAFIINEGPGSATTDLSILSNWTHIIRAMPLPDLDPYWPQRKNDVYLSWSSTI
ncbi:uncharacterized protein LAESUDRAFT_732922 [Laetiporus sulphureus 93-53]|uniref:Uncharacterized protein n=1 Tax=Laetiporus sulphureus 93-53 TaxID=1314785 RepID=A0A165AVG6_9APHY|nr:uncharacterized protein LAESUDRAFT_732922 [Laetiporus sulphureus 93-53]KZS99742.1 hypothetical protein LAESUDRAFT_732922 [Laetiporus sulphureus 93-53]